MIQNMSLAGLAAETKAEFAYSGAYTQKQITSGGVTYDLYTLTGSGTLTVTGIAKKVDVWTCGGGVKGGTGNASYSSASGGYGGAGAYCKTGSGLSLTGTYSVIVGAAGGNSSFAGQYIALAGSGKNGGTGGGGNGKGDGITKYPFEDSANFKCHCAGGGGGRWSFRDISQPYPSSGSTGSGGTNGGNGSGSGTAGGDYGGGSGGYYAGGAATFYGSGGGGGAGEGSTQGSFNTYAGGAGYQGVVYIRVPT